MGMQSREGFVRLEGYLVELGWSYRLAYKTSILACYEGQFGTTEVLFSFSPKGLRICVHPVLQKPKEGWSTSVHRLVKTLAADNRLIHIGVDRVGEIYVKVDLPKNLPNFDQFTFVLFHLCHLSEELLIPILQAQALDVPRFLSGISPATSRFHRYGIC